MRNTGQCPWCDGAVFVPWGEENIRRRPSSDLRKRESSGQRGVAEAEFRSGRFRDRSTAGRKESLAESAGDGRGRKRGAWKEERGGRIYTPTYFLTAVPAGFITNRLSGRVSSLCLTTTSRSYVAERNRPLSHSPLRVAERHGGGQIRQGDQAAGVVRDLGVDNARVDVVDLDVGVHRARNVGLMDRQDRREVGVYQGT
ncbi:hypothetical protein OF83DRAFT_1086006 [Amylostereum chailletii]|nr:hypothetical protein OF83DRAFT_1086006 [Amylostereum chailletii]